MPRSLLTAAIEQARADGTLAAAQKKTLKVAPSYPPVGEEPTKPADDLEVILGSSPPKSSNSSGSRVLARLNQRLSSDDSDAALPAAATVTDVNSSVSSVKLGDCAEDEESEEKLAFYNMGGASNNGIFCFDEPVPLTPEELADLADEHFKEESDQIKDAQKEKGMAPLSLGPSQTAYNAFVDYLQNGGSVWELPVQGQGDSQPLRYLSDEVLASGQPGIFAK